MNESEKENKFYKNLVTFIDKFDSILIANTGNDSVGNSYYAYLKNFKEINDTSRIVVDTHDLVEDKDFEYIFNSIWRLSWVITTSYNYELWLDYNLEDGMYWKYLSKNKEKLSSVNLIAYKTILKYNDSIAFDYLIQNCADINLEDEVNKNLIAIILITRIINSE